MAALTYGVVARPKPGYGRSGDTWRVLAGEQQALVVLADGLGSGEAAAEASERAVATVEQHCEEPLTEIMRHCHEALLETRGAAVGILRVRYEPPEVAFVGVGNIEVRTTADSRFKPVSTNGIVGANYRAPRVYEREYRSGDWLVLHSDGLSTRYDLDRELQQTRGSVQEFAERLAAGYARGNDDLAVLVMRLP